MARKPTTYTEPDDDELEQQQDVLKPEPDEPQYMQPVPEQEVAVTPQAAGTPDQLTFQIPPAAQTHIATVTAAKGMMQGSVGAAATSYKAGGSLATFQAAIKSANIAYYQSVMSSGQTNSQQIAGAIEALRTLGAM